MFIAHLPAGYLLSRSLPSMRAGANARCLMAGSLLPDVDLIWFYLVDAGSVHHHGYLTHRPALWGLILICGLASRGRWPSACALGLGGLLHMALDTFASAIAWGWPLTSMPYTLIVVPATRDWWVMSFLTHWSIWVEGAICAAAIAQLIATRVGRGPA